MSRFIIYIIIAVLILGGAVYFWQAEIAKAPTDNMNNSNETTQNLNIKSNNMKITSSVFINNENIPVKYTCDGEGVNPPLRIEGVPDSAQSLALIVDDPDAPSGTFIHWTLWNIKPQTTEIPENSVPAGSVQGATSTGDPGYVSPCPPTGTHRYNFKLYALDTELQLDSSARIDELTKAMEGHMLASAEYMGKYSR